MFEFPTPLATNRFEDDVVAILARLQRGPLPQRPIAFYGSSSFRLWGTMQQDLQSLDIVNLGFGGGTNLSGRHYLQKLLIPLKPERIVLYFGENDIANDGLTGQTTFEHMKALLADIRAELPAARIFVLGTKQSPTRWIYADEVDRYNALTEAWCGESGQAHFIDASRGLIGENGRPMGRYYQPDFIHLNAGGYALWAEVLKRIPELLA
ncbi:Lysophospholipase L1 [Rhizobium sp. RU35A]|uniref:Lysophospholipase n=1 Tax=Rhizobium straminoryzae TaxID=1387186 RepID=A0A549TDT1_9HYPH|nr:MULTISPECIES: GDSL-type esterase/lipase family protein [Rhizobium]TRL40226.1 lysophospholipase [Rhizobium straminoryzae]SIQ59367.1 Lysophospholipase L1 [Rhizobium sp. RU35A]